MTVCPLLSKSLVMAGACWHVDVVVEVEALSTEPIFTGVWREAGEDMVMEDEPNEPQHTHSSGKTKNRNQFLLET